MFTLNLYDVYDNEDNCVLVEEKIAEKAKLLYGNHKEIFVTSSLKKINNQSVSFGMEFDDYPWKPAYFIGKNEVLNKAVFANNRNIEFVILGKNITALDDSAFRNCTNLKEVVLSDQTNIIGQYAFADCTSLKSIRLADCEVIPEGAFKNCTSLEYIFIPEGCVNIDYMAFANCTSLKKVFLPQSLELWLFAKNKKTFRLK